jgi:hypothetical protein
MGGWVDGWMGGWVNGWKSRGILFPGESLRAIYLEQSITLGDYFSLTVTALLMEKWFQGDQNN